MSDVETSTTDSESQNGRNSTTDTSGVTETQHQVAEAVVVHVPRWALHRRLYDWVLSWADRPQGPVALFILSFAESSFFPVPPDVLLAPLVLGSRKRWFTLALSCSIASVIGGVFGYLIGMLAWEGGLDQIFYNYVPGVTEEKFITAQGWYEKWNFWVVFAAGFTPLPYKVITISAGVFEIGFVMFLIASTVGRSARFFLVAGLFGRYGETIKPFVDKYFNLLCVLFLILLVGGFYVIKHLH